MNESARRIDRNSYMTIDRNPIIREGVFPYSGKMIGAPDPNKIYYVYRPREELEKLEFIESLKLLPFVDEHAMLGDPDEGLEAAEKKGTHGTTGEKIVCENGVVFSNLKIFSKTLRNMVETVKKELSLGYRAVYEAATGYFNGQPYDYIQRNLVGNHLALVVQGRNDVAVLDHFTFDHFEVMDEQTEEKTMADETTNPTDEGKKDLTLDEVLAFFKQYMPKLQELVTAAGVTAEAKEEVEEAAAETTLDEDDKKDEDKEKKTEDESDKKEKDSMDSAAEIKTLKARLASLEGKDSIQDAVSDINKRNRLAGELSQVIGTFDHAEMTSAGVIKYGVEKLGLKPAKGQEETAITAYLAGRKQTTVGFALDSKEPVRSSEIDAYLKSKA